MAPALGLSLNDWAVLGLIAEGRTHGFALSRECAHDGAMGRVWTISRPLVYRAITALGERGLVAEVGSVPGAGGPRRRLVEASDRGRLALDQWMAQPVAHVRDARSELLVKLLLHDRAGSTPRRLLEAQQALFRPMLEGLRAQLAGVEGFDATLIRWRLASVEALARLLEELLEQR